MLINVDFAENLTYNNFPRSVQSAHWKSYQLTIFVAVIRFLNTDVWNDSTSLLWKGDEVSFQAEDINDVPGMLRYGELLEDQGEICTVFNEQKEYIHKRKFVSLASLHI
jgi:hypothetical protein